jgi:hypothetical protein
MIYVIVKEIYVLHLHFLAPLDDTLIGERPDPENANWRTIIRDFDPEGAERRAKATARMTSQDMLLTDYR